MSSISFLLRDFNTLMPVFLKLLIFFSASDILVCDASTIFSTFAENSLGDIFLLLGVSVLKIDFSGLSFDSLTFSIVVDGTTIIGLLDTFFAFSSFFSCTALPSFLSTGFLYLIFKKSKISFSSLNFKSTFFPFLPLTI